MNMYRFGNYICRLREDKGMTQAELAQELDVSDNSISKWENGQAFPRIETFERLANILGTTMQDILSASKDGVNRICLVNAHAMVMQIEVNGALYALRHNEGRWIEVEPGEIILTIRGDTSPIETPPRDEDATSGGNLRIGVTRSLKGISAKMCLHVGCTYRLNVADEQIITIGTGDVEVEEPLWILPSFNIEYPKISENEIRPELLDVNAIDRGDAISAYKKMSIAWTLGGNFLMLFLVYPLSGLFARWQCRKTVIHRHIENAGAIREPQNKKKSGWCGIILLLCVVIVLALLRMLPPIVGNGGDYLVSMDRQTITRGEDTYHRIDALPEDAVPTTLFGAQIWEDAWIEGNFWDRLEQDVKVQLFEDEAKNRYLWLVEDYVATMLPEDISEPQYGDFETHMVYALE